MRTVLYGTLRDFYVPCTDRGCFVTVVVGGGAVRRRRIRATAAAAAAGFGFAAATTTTTTHDGCHPNKRYTEKNVVLAVCLFVCWCGDWILAGWFLPPRPATHTHQTRATGTHQVTRK